MSALRRGLAAICAAVLLAAQARAADAPIIGTPPVQPDGLIAPGYRPATDSDEGGLWMMSQKAEDAFKTSPLLIRDPALNAYLMKIVCKLAKDHCGDVRLYVLDLPLFNAAMSPNGALQIWTGLILRAKNEAQLACVLGHEISHYQLRHTLAQWHRMVNATGAMAVLGIVTAGAGVGLIGVAANLGIASSVMSFTRDEEREADAHGQDLAAAAGYDPAACAGLWQEQLAEQTAEPDETSGFIFLRSHPASKERLAVMQSRAAAMPAPATPYVTDTAERSAAIAPFRARWLDEELNRGRYGQSLVLVQALLEGAPDSGELRYYLAEVYRRRNANGDAAAAADAYKAAIADGNAPVTAYRGLGITAMKSGDPASARDAFQHYLAVAPAADDKAMIDYYLAHLGDKT